LVVSGAGAASQGPADASKNPVICTQDPIGSEVGTHLRSKKVCMTKSDRDFIEEEQRAKVMHINNNGNDRLRDIPPPPRRAPGK
jgi:hypothetical protein